MKEYLMQLDTFQLNVLVVLFLIGLGLIAKYQIDKAREAEEKLKEDDRIRKAVRDAEDAEAMWLNSEHPYNDPTLAQDFI